MRNLLNSRAKVKQIELLSGTGRLLIMLFIFFLASGSLIAYAQTGGDYTLTWWTVDHGGLTGSTGGAYKLLSTAGQPEADPSAAAGGGYTLLSGFWPSRTFIRPVYLPLVLKMGAPQPDLVGSFSLTPNQTSFNAGEAVQITTVVANQGTARAEAFWVDFYINPSAMPGVNVPWHSVCGLSPCYGLAWYVGGLDPGQSVTLTSTSGSYAAGYTNWPGYFAGGTSDLYLYVDSWNPTVSTGGVLESNEGNNRAELHGLSVRGLDTAGEEPPPEIPDRPARLD